MQAIESMAFLTDCHEQGPYPVRKPRISMGSTTDPGSRDGCNPQLLAAAHIVSPAARNPRHDGRHGSIATDRRDPLCITRIREWHHYLLDRSQAYT